jgi:hypothetical protein
MLDFLIIGAPKSGSSYLHRCMEAHPQVYMPSGETIAFDDRAHVNGGLEKIKDIERRGVGKKVGIKRPALLAIPEAPRRIFEHSPNAKLVAILRNPVDRAVSAYFYLIMRGFLPILPLNEGMKRVLDGNIPDSQKKFLEYGFYHKHIVRYLHYFRREQMFILINSELRKFPDRVISEIYSHIGVDKTYNPRVPARRSNLGVYSLPRLKFINLRNRFVFRFDEDMTRAFRKTGILAKVMNIVIRGGDYAILSHIFNNEEEKLAPDLRERIRDIYMEDIIRLEDFLDKRLDDWKI